MKKYKYNQKPILVYDFCILQYNLEPRNLLTDAPVLSSIDENGFVKVCSVALDENVRIDKYENKNGDILYKDGIYPYRMFPLDSFKEHLQTCVAFCLVESSADENVSVRISCNCKSKVFLNEMLLAVNQQEINQFVKCRLKKGLNTFVIECYNILSNSGITLRIGNLESEEENRLDALEYTNCSTFNRFLSVVYQTDPAARIINYYAYLDDSINDYRHLTYIGEVYDCDSRNIGSFVPVLDQAGIIDLSEYPVNKLEIPVVSIRFSVYDGNTLLYTTQRPIIIGDLSETNERILRQADELLKSGRLCPYDKYYLKQRIQFAHRVGSAANAVWTQTGFIRSVLKHFSNGLKMADVFHMPKNHIIHFRNPLDNQTDTYSVVTPDDYDQANLYSLIININNANSDNQNVFYNYNLDKKTIFADIYLKGINLGSYVGEASFFAYLNDIKKRFSIDENRIYITGGCNGGSAVYSLAQNYPHLFAAVLSVTGSSFLPSIGNLYNLPVYNVYSEADENFSDLKREQKERLESLPLAKNINVESCSHRIIMSSMQRSNVLDALLSHTRNMYPEHIKYRTERNYHRKCYWIELLGISFGKCFCEAEVFASSSLITISLTNCLGIKIEIPPYINRNNFCIKLNGQAFTFSKYRKKHIIIVQRNGIYEITDICTVVSQIKGMGILSVYLRPLRIICDTSDLIQMNAAQKLSEPVTMGYKSKMLVKYPISDHSAHLPAKYNMIMIRKYDCKTAYDDLMQVRCEKNGYRYHNVYYEDNYVIMEAAQLTDSGTILVMITYNDERLLSTMMFLRRMILPAYLNGRHAFLNNQVLIYRNRKFFSIYEKDDEIREIESSS